MEETIRTFTGQIIGYIKTLSNGDKEVRNFTGQILGYYRKSQNITTNFTGQILFRGQDITNKRAHEYTPKRKRSRAFRSSSPFGSYAQIRSTSSFVR